MPEAFRRAIARRVAIFALAAPLALNLTQPASAQSSSPGSPLPPSLALTLLASQGPEVSVPPMPPGFHETVAGKTTVAAGAPMLATRSALEQIPLLAGFNLVSLPEEPTDPDPGVVFAPIAGQLSNVFAYDACDPDPWKLYDPADAAASDLLQIEITQGLWVQTTAPALLPSEGVLPPTTTFELCVGWNLIGFPSAHARPVRNALHAIEGKYVRLFGYDPSDPVDPWEIFDIAVPDWANDLQLMQPGRGYWILVTEATTLELANDDEPPYVEIHAPAETDRIFDLTDVVGTVRSKILDSWEITARPLDGEVPIPVARGVVPAEIETLGVLDPTMLLNGPYELTLSATDLQGRTASTSVHLTIEGEQKIGHVRLSFVDTELQLSHLAMKVIRTYDSRDRREQGDFGHGWSLSMSDIQVQENIAPGDFWQGTVEGELIPTYCIESSLPHIIAVTFPSGEIFRYRVALDPQCTIAAPPQVVELSLEPLSGPEPAELVPQGRRTDLFVAGSFPGPVQLFDLDTGLPSNPDAYALTMQDDTELVINEDSGLVSLTERNGRSLQFSSNGIAHSKGHEIDFVRDAEGRITQITTITGETLVYDYDDAGDLVALTDEVGDTVRFTYIRDHLLHEIIAADGTRILANEYDDDSRLIGSCDHLDRCHQATHDLTGKVETITNPNGVRHVRTYDEQGRVLSETNNLGHTYHFEYNDQGLVEKATDPLGHTTEFAWQNADLIRIVEPHDEGEDPADYTTHYGYNSRGQVTSMIFPSGGGLEMTYDAEGNRTSITDENGVPLLTREYDGEGRLLSETNPFGTMVFENYDDFDNPGRIANGSLDLLLDYDDLGQLTAIDDGLIPVSYRHESPRRVGVDQPDVPSRDFDLAGDEHLSRWTEGERVLFERREDVLGRVERLSTPVADADIGRDAAGLIEQVTVDGQLIRFERDAIDRVVRIVPAGRPALEMTLDAVGQLTELREADSVVRFVYRPNGELETVTDPLGRTTRQVLTPTTRTLTDPLGRTTVEHLTPHGLVARQVFDDGSERSWTYALTNSLVDADEYPSEIVDESGRSRLYTYGDRMALVSASDLAGTAYAYTADRGQLATVTDPDGRVSTYAYDAALRLRTLTREDGGVEELRYPNAVGLLPEARILPSGREIAITYDDFTEVASLSSSDGESETFVWQRPGAIASATNALGTTSTSYEPVYQQVSRVALPSGQAVDYRYDDRGRLEAIDATAPGGIVRTTSYTYDVVGRVTSVTDPLGGITTFEYDLVDRPTRRTLPNGVVTDYGYDVRDRITSITHRDADGVVLASSDLVRSPSGEPERVTFADGSSVDYVYDAALRLSEERHLSPAGAVDEVISYTYDQAGNRLTRTSDGGSETYTYGAGHRLATVTGGGDSRTFTTDADGRVVAIAEGGSTRTFDYDFLDRQTAVSLDGLESVRYELDAEGRRVAVMAGAERRNYLVADAGAGLRKPHLVTDGGDALVSGYVYALGVPLLRYDASGAPVYYLEDAMGSIVALADDGGATLASFGYDGFGNLRPGSTAIDSAAGGDFGFHGGWFDTATGFYHLSAREYDPRLGRFLSRDPIPFQADRPELSHPYVFVANNPLLYSDPGGLYGGINEQSIMAAIQSTLSNIKARFVQKLVREIIQEARQRGLELTISQAKNMILDGFNVDAIPLKENPATFRGRVFENALTKAFCSLKSIGWADRMWFQPVISPTTGHPSQNGVSCQDIKEGRTGTRAKFKERKPDLVMMMSPNSRPIRGKGYGRAFFIGDAKISIQSAVNQWSGGERDQYLAIRRYAWKHAFAVATVWSFNEGKVGSCRALQKFFQQGNGGPNDKSKVAVIGVRMFGGICAPWDKSKKKK